MYTFILHKDLETLEDSMLYDSGLVIATIFDDKHVASLEVRGEQRIVYEGNVYKYVQDFPQEIVDMIRSNTIWDNPDVVIDNNNWFEVMVGKVWEDGTHEFYDGYVYESEVPNNDSEMLTVILDYLDYLKDKDND